jgi:hypothetical protein
VSEATPLFPLRPPYVLRCLQAEAADEDGKAAKDQLRVRSEEIVAPGDGVAQGLLAGRGIARASAQQVESLTEPLPQRFRGEQSHPRRGELDGQRQSIQPAHDLGDDGTRLVGQDEGRSDPGGAVQEELDRL